MKKGRWFFYNLFLVLALAIPASSAVIDSGTVSDSVSGVLLNSVRICCLSPACSTFSVNGRYVLSHPVTQVKNSISQKGAMKIFFDPAKNYFYAGEEKVFLELRNARGELIAGANLPSGNYFVVCRFGAFKFLNIAGRRQEIIYSGGYSAITGLAKTAAASSVLATFSLAGYNTKQVTLYVAPHSNPVRLSKIPTGSNASLNVSVVPNDTLKGIAIIP